MAKPIQWTPEIVPNGGIDETRSPSQIADNKWSSATNAEPLFDGVRSRQGTSASNSVALQAISESHEGGTDERAFTDTSSEYIAQGFQSSGALTVSRVAVRLKIDAGSPTGTIHAAIYDSSAGQPNAVVTNADFTDFTNIDSTTLTSEFSWYFFTLTTAVSLTAATTYHVVIRHLGAAAGNTVDIEEVTTPSGYANGNVDFSTDASSWTAVAAADLNFRIYSGASSITGIKDYRLSDASTTRHMVLHGGELYKNVGGTMTAVSARERAVMTSAATTFPSLAEGQDRLFVAPGGTEHSRKFYVLSGTEYWENEGIDAPTATPTVTAVAGGSLADDTYHIDYYYWNNDLAIPSNRRYNGVSTPNATTSGTDNTIRVANLPAVTVRENDRATHLRIEIRRQSTMTIFRFQVELTLGTTTTDITSLSTTTEAEYDHFEPPTHTIKQVAENRQFIAGNDTNPDRVYWSHITGTTAYYESFPTNNFRDFGQSGDYVTALAFVPPRALIVGMKNSIWAIDARRPGTSDRVLIARGVGIAHHVALRVVGRRLWFISDADLNKGPFVWDGVQVRPVLGIDNTFKSLNQTRIRYASCAHLAPGDNRFQWWTLLSGAGSGTHNRILVYDYLIGSWTVYDHANDFNVLGEIEASSVTSIYAGGTNGVEYQTDTGGNDVGTAINATVQLKAFDFGDQEHFKKLRFVNYVAAEQSTGSMNLSIEPDFGEGATTTAQLGHLGTTGMLWNTGVWGTGIWGGKENVARRVALNKTRGRYLRPTVNSTDAWHLKSLSFGLQLTGRR